MTGGETRQFFEALMAPALLAIFGGIARSCRFGVAGWRQFLGSAIVSGFTGVVVHLLLQETMMSASVQAAIVAASGYSGGAILDALSLRIIKGVEHMPGPGQKWNGAERRKQQETSTTDENR